MRGVAVIKITKGKPPKADNHEVHQPVVGEAEPRAPNLKALAKSFAPVIELRAVEDLKVNPRNARTHSARQVQQIAASVREFGWVAPIVVDEEGTVLAGHGRLQAAPLLGLGEVPTIQVKHLTPARKRAFMLADNRLAELSGWDEDLLAIELKELSSLDIDFNFEVTGFDTIDVDRREAPASAKPSEQEVVPELERDRPAVSAPSDLWKLGQHLLLCGSALEEASYEKLLGNERVEMMFTDPPYNVKIDGHVCGLGSVNHRNFQMAAGEMSESEFTALPGHLHGSSYPIQRRRRHSPDLHGLAPYGRGPGRRPRPLRAQKPLRVEQDQRRDGNLLPLQARAGVRVQGGQSPAHQQLRAG